MIAQLDFVSGAFTDAVPSTTSAPSSVACFAAWRFAKRCSRALSAFRLMTRAFLPFLAEVGAFLAAAAFPFTGVFDFGAGDFAGVFFALIGDFAFTGVLFVAFFAFAIALRQK